MVNARPESEPKDPSVRPVTIMKQQKLGSRRGFLFGPDKLTCTINDHTGEKRFSVYYDAIEVLDPYIVVISMLGGKRGLRN
jgi:hypothetical protein